MPISTISQAGLNAPITLTSPTLTTPNINSAQVATVSGTAPLYMCRAWVNFNGTGTVAIRASGNVSSITDSGAGRYTVNFTTAMPDANYATQVTIYYSILLPSSFTAATTSIAVNVDNASGVPTDISAVAVSVFR